MMEKKNLDRLFQEKFRDFEVAPPENMWPKIEAELTKKKKRRVIPLWYKLSGVAALFIIGLGVFMLMNNSSSNGGSTVVQQPIPSENNETETGTDSIGNENESGNKLMPKAVEAVVDGSQSEGQHNSGSSSENQYESQAGSENKKPSGVKSRTEIRSTQTGVAVSESTESVKSQRKSKSAGTKSDRNLKVLSPDENLIEKQQDKTQVAGIGTGNTTSQPKQINTTTPEKPALEQKNTQIATTEKGKSSVKSAQNQTQNNSETPASANPISINPASEQQAVVQVTKAEPQPDSTAIATVEPNALEELLNEKENKVTASEQKINRWQITSSVAPIYFSSTSNGSPLDSRFESTGKTYKPSVSYGVGAQYAVTKRLSVRSGVNAVSLEYNTNDLVFFQTPDATPIANVKTNMQGSIIQVDATQAPLTMSAKAASAGKRTFEGSLNQRTAYIEVPVEMSYKLLDKKFGIDVIGGLSTLFLNENSITLESTGMNMNIGEAENLNDVHFSTNVGLGFSYRFLKSFEANFEPMFKYQLNTYSNSAGNFRPYFFGLYTGVSFRF